MKSCQIASISILDASSDPVKGNSIRVALHDHINASCSLHISAVTLGDAILITICNRSNIKKTAIATWVVVAKVAEIIVKVIIIKVKVAVTNYKPSLYFILQK